MARLAALLIGIAMLTLVLPAQPAGCAEDLLYGGGIHRIQLIKDFQSVEQDISFTVPGAHGVVTPMPSIQVVTMSLVTDSGIEFEFRYSPFSAEAKPFSLDHFEADTRLAYGDASRGLNALASFMLGESELAPYAGLFQAASERRGVLNATRDHSLLTISRYNASELKGADVITVGDLGERSIRLRETPGQPNEFTVAFAGFPGKEIDVRVISRAMGNLAFVSSPMLPPNLSREDIVVELGVFLDELLPVVTVAAHNNYKIEQVRAALARVGSEVKAVKFVRPAEAAAPAAPVAPSHYDVVAEFASGYSAQLRRENVERKVYHYRTGKVCGFITQDIFPSYARVTITGNRRYFDPNPLDSETLPLPDFIWSTSYPHGVNQPEVPPMPLHLGDLALTDRDLFFYREATGLFGEALADDGFRDAISGDLLLALRKFTHLSGEFRSEEAVRPLLSLSYHEVQGLTEMGLLTYQDMDYTYQLGIPPRPGFVSFAFAYEPALAPEVYRFYLAPAGNGVQLVASYPVQMPIGRAARTFNRSASSLVRLRDLTTYMARHDPMLAQVPPLINEIWGDRELIGPKMFIRPSHSGMYTDWLTADTLVDGQG
jgi:hypothetical protein